MKKNPNVKYAVVGTGNRGIDTLGFLMYKIVYKNYFAAQDAHSGRKMRFCCPLKK